MKHLIVLLIAVVTFIAIRVFKNQKKWIIVGSLLGMTLFSLWVTFKEIGVVTDLIRPYNQLFYQKEYLEEGIYPDAILPLMVKDKKVLVRDDIEDYDLSTPGPEYWEAHLGEIHYGINAENLLKAYGAKTVRDASLNDIEITDDIKSDFAELGIDNDMYRFSSAVGNIKEKYGNYFHYYYVYGAYGRLSHVYLHVDDKGSLKNGSGSELVALWDNPDKGYGEDLYIMDKAYFDSKLRK